MVSITRNVKDKWSPESQDRSRKSCKTVRKIGDVTNLSDEIGKTVSDGKWKLFTKHVIIKNDKKIIRKTLLCENEILYSNFEISVNILYSFTFERIR